MYEELIKRLRKSCGACKLWDGYKCCLKGECTAQTRLQAADAVEKLQAAEKKYLANIGALETENQHLKRERAWIPVTERLPELHGEEFSEDSGETVRYQCSEPVLIWLGGGGDFIAIGMYEVDDHFEGWTMGGSVLNCITHWMQIPKPPKEE